MNQIETCVNRESNFIYHMLSVSKCGYDNAYGAKYRPFHNPEDLALLKKHEKLLTVCGGEHCG